MGFPIYKGDYVRAASNAPDWIIKLYGTTKLRVTDIGNPHIGIEYYGLTRFHHWSYFEKCLPPQVTDHGFEEYEEIMAIVKLVEN